MGHWFGAVPRGSMFREVRGARERRAGGDDEVAREGRHERQALRTVVEHDGGQGAGLAGGGRRSGGTRATGGPYPRQTTAPECRTAQRLPPLALTER